MMLLVQHSTHQGFTMSDALPHFARRLGELLEEQGVSQYRLAQQIGLSRQAVNQLVSGKASPAWDTVQLVCKVLSVKCQEFEDPGLQPPPSEPAKPRGRPKKEPEQPAEKKAKGKKGGAK